jgi:tetratricopeptide (TPR) repeat protein
MLGLRRLSYVVLLVVLTSFAAAAQQVTPKSNTAAQQAAPKSSATNAAAQQPAPKKSAPAPKKQSSTPSETDQEREARLHYKTALAALANNDLPAAEEELKAAANLTPKNPLIFYNLAVVQSKRDETKDAFDSLEQAEILGIPADSKNAAEDLHASLQYKLKKQAEAEEEERKRQLSLEKLHSVEGTWRYERERRDGIRVEHSELTIAIEKAAPAIGFAKYWSDVLISQGRGNAPWESSCDEEWNISEVSQSADKGENVYLLHLTAGTHSVKRDGFCVIDRPDAWIEVSKEAQDTLKYNGFTLNSTK